MLREVERSNGSVSVQSRVGSAIARLSHAAVTAAAFWALAAVAPGVSLAAERGLSTDLTWGISSSDQSRTAALLPDVGSRWVRLTFAWKDVETRNGFHNNSTLATYDAAVDLARQAGQKIDVAVYTTPPWASSGDTNAPPANNADYADFMSFLANRYRGRVNAWEIWNEQNTSRFWSTGPNAAQYTGLLRAAYPAVKAADPNAIVAFGGVSLNDYSFIEGAYAAGAKGYFDVMAVHPYTGRQPPEWAPTWNGRINPGAFLGYREVRQDMLAKGDNKPIWLTEFGWSTTSASGGVGFGAQGEQVQADYLTRAYRCADVDPYVTVAFWYHFRNNYWNQDADGWEFQHGLMHTDFSPKPSYYAFKNYTPGASSCASVPASGGSPDRLAAGHHVAGVDRRRVTTIVVRVARARSRAARSARTRRTKLVVTGKVRGASGGRITLPLERAGRPRRWQMSGLSTGRIGHDGSFRTTIVAGSPGRWRVRALFPGDISARPSNSRIVYFRA